MAAEPAAPEPEAEGWVHPIAEAIHWSLTERPEEWSRAYDTYYAVIQNVRAGVSVSLYESGGLSSAKVPDLHLSASEFTAWERQQIADVAIRLYKRYKAAEQERFEAERLQRRTQALADAVAAIRRPVPESVL
jgi:hypothetical protein